MVTLCLDFFPPLQLRLFWAKPWSGRAQKNNLVSFMFQMLSFEQPWTISGSRSFQESIISPCNSPDSLQIFNCLIANLFYYFSSHPCDPLNSGLPKVATIIFTFSIGHGPPTGIFLDLASTNHLRIEGIIDFTVLRVASLTDGVNPTARCIGLVAC